MARNKAMKRETDLAKQELSQVKIGVTQFRPDTFSKVPLSQMPLQYGTMCYLEPRPDRFSKVPLSQNNIAIETVRYLTDDSGNLSGLVIAQLRNP